MTDIEQKAREVAAKHYYGDDTDNFGCCSAACKNCEHGAPDYLCELCQLEAAIAAALQSAVAEEREECRRYIHEHESVDGCTDGHGGIFETCQFASCIDLRARGQKEKP